MSIRSLQAHGNTQFALPEVPRAAGGVWILHWERDFTSIFATSSGLLPLLAAGDLPSSSLTLASLLLCCFISRHGLNSVSTLLRSGKAGSLDPSLKFTLGPQATFLPLLLTDLWLAGGSLGFPPLSQVPRTLFSSEFSPGLNWQLIVFLWKPPFLLKLLKSCFSPTVAIQSYTSGIDRINVSYHFTSAQMVLNWGVIVYFQIFITLSSTIK